MKILAYTKKIYKVLHHHKGMLALIILMCILAALFNSLAPYFIGYATDSLYNSYTQSIAFDIKLITKILLVALGCYLLNAICSYFKSFLSSEHGQKEGYGIRKKVFDKITRIKISRLDQIKKGDIISKIINDTERLTDSITAIIPDLIYSFSLIIGFIVMMFVIDPLLALISLLVVPINYVLLKLVVRKSQKYFDLNQKAIGNVNSFIEESVTNNDVIKTFNKEDYFNRKFNKESKTLANYGFKSSFYSSLAVPFSKLISSLNYVIVCGVGAFNVLNGSLRIGAIQSFIQYLKDFNKPLNTISQVTSNIQMAIASIDRINEILELPEDENGYLTDFTFNNKIEFKNVTFAYVKDKPVLKNFNLTIDKGQRIGIVGKTGAGKTTIINLLLGFYDDYEGQILIDGVSIKDLDQSEYRKQMSMVHQDTWLFEGTIKDNIIFDDKISDDNLSGVLSKSKISHMINSLPGGLNFTINEESDNMSEGEKQLLTIARAIVKNPKILILDEATSNVDTRVEKIISNSLTELMKEKTSIIIAHRLSTIETCDKIIVVKDGTIIESGKHKDLLKNKGYYYELYNSGLGD